MLADAMALWLLSILNLVNLKNPLLIHLLVFRAFLIWLQLLLVFQSVQLVKQIHLPSLAPTKQEIIYFLTATLWQLQNLKVQLTLKHLHINLWNALIQVRIFNVTIIFDCILILIVFCLKLKLNRVDSGPLLDRDIWALLNILVYTLDHFQPILDEAVIAFLFFRVEVDLCGFRLLQYHLWELVIVLARLNSVDLQL